MKFSFGYTMSPLYNWDRLAAIYITIAILWTGILVSGIITLIINRDLPYIKIRNVPLAISAVALLHVYWCLSMTAYILNGNFPCGVEFWIMSTYLPLGIALYQASNTQLLHIAGLQRKFAYGEEDSMDNTPELKPPSRRQKVVVWWTGLEYTQKTMGAIAIGMVAQVRSFSLRLIRGRR